MKILKISVNLFQTSNKISQNTLKQCISTNKICQKNTKNNDDKNKEVENKDPITPSDRSPLRVAIIGAASRVGRLVALQIKPCIHIDELALYDTAKKLSSIGQDLSNINTHSVVHVYRGESNLQAAIKGSKIVVICCGKERSVADKDLDIFEENAEMVKAVAQECVNVAPSTFVVVGDHPIECFVPMINEIFKASLQYNQTKIFGVSSYAASMTNYLLGLYFKKDSSKRFCPVIGGVSNSSVVPLLTGVQPKTEISDSEIEKLTCTIRRYTEQLLEQRQKILNVPNGIPYLIAHSIAELVLAVVQGINSIHNGYVTAYVKHVNPSVLEYFAYMSTHIQIGPNGVKNSFFPDQLSPYELKILEWSLYTLIRYARHGVSFASCKCCEDYPRPCHTDSPCDYNEQ